MALARTSRAMIDMLAALWDDLQVCGQVKQDI